MTRSMTEGSITKQLLLFSFPVLAGSFFQQFYNTVDAIVVGRYLGKGALAAVGGTTGIIFWLIVSMFQGISSGAGVVIAQAVGAKDSEGVKKGIHTAFWIALIIGSVIMIFGQPLCRFAISFVDTPEDIFDDALIYLRFLLIGIIPNLLCSMGTCVLHAMGNSRVPFIFLIFSTITNIVLDILLVTKVKLGVKGVAIATTLSQVLSTVLIFIYLIKKLKIFSFKDFRIEKSIFHKMIKIGFPAGFQSASLAVTNLAIQSRINILGTDYSAANAAFCKIGNFYWMVTSALVLSTVTFISQNYGGGRIDRVKKGLKRGTLLYLSAIFIVGSLFLLLGKPLLSIFSDDVKVINYGFTILQLATFTYIFYMPVDILAGALRSTGDVNAPTVFTFFGICVLTVLYNVFIFPLSPNIVTVMLCYPFTWIVTSVMFIIYYYKKSSMRKMIKSERG